MHTEMLFADNIKLQDRIAVRDDKGNHISYQQIYEEAVDMDEYKNGRVLTLIYCDNSFENLVIIFKLFFLGQPMLLLSQNSDMNFRKDILEKFNPQYIWEKGKLKKNSGNAAFYEIHPELALLLSTSGSIGKPKLTRISYQNIKRELLIGVEEFRIRDGQKGLQILPIEHVYGLAFCLYHWIVGGCVVTTDAHVMSSQFDYVYDKEGIQNMAGIPFHYRILLKKGFWQDKERILRLNFAVTAGAKLDESDQNTLVSLLHEKFFIAYGQTECTAIVTASAFRDSTAKLGTVGKPVRGVKTSLDEIGELCIESPTVCLGYALDYKDLAKGDANQGIVTTGDLAFIDEDGYIFLKGRSRRFVKILGNRIGLDDLETLLRKNFFGHEFACTGENDELNVFIEQSIIDSQVNLYTELLYKKADIPISMIHCYFVENLPRSSAGKILYSELDSLLAIKT